MAFNLLFLGTCAADFSPKLRGECKDCFDRDARRASCLLINGRYLVDCGPHAQDSMRIAGVDLSSVTDLFVTHFHGDHWNAENVKTLAAACKGTLNVWVRQDAVLPEIPNIQVKYMEDCREYDAGDGLTVTGFRANHDESVWPQHFLFALDGKKFYYGTDGAWFLNRTFNALKGAQLDAIVWDATCGDYNGDFRLAEHNSIPMLRMMVPSLKTVGILRDDTKIFLTHLAPSLHRPHEETQTLVDADGFTVAYDGMEVLLS